MNVLERLRTIIARGQNRVFLGGRPTAHIISSTFVGAPPHSVFGAFTDLENAAERIEDVVSLEKLTDGPMGVGTGFREARIMLRRAATEEPEVTAFESEKSYCVGC